MIEPDSKTLTFVEGGGRFAFRRHFDRAHAGEYVLPDARRLRERGFGFVLRDVESGGGGLASVARFAVGLEEGSSVIEPVRFDREDWQSEEREE